MHSNAYRSRVIEMTPAIRRIIVSQGINYISCDYLRTNDGRTAKRTIDGRDDQDIESEFWYMERLWTRQRIDEESVLLTSIIIRKF